MSRAGVVTIGIIVFLLLCMRAGLSDKITDPSPSPSSELTSCLGRDNDHVVCQWP